MTRLPRMANEAAMIVATVCMLAVIAVPLGRDFPAMRWIEPPIVHAQA